MLGVFGRKRFSGGIYGLLLICLLLLSNCDMMGGSVDEFIKHNTGNVTLNSLRITSRTSEGFETSGGVWIHDPKHGLATNTEKSSDVIVFEAKIENPQNYDLVITPVIYEYIGEPGKTLADAPEIIIRSMDSNILTVQIGSVGKPVKQGDSFRVRIDMATKDGTRTFDPYIVPYQIIHDSLLLAAREIGFSNPVAESEYLKLTTWNMQDSDSHKGINKISITFTSRLNTAWRTLNFERVYDENGETQSWNFIKENINSDPYYLNADQPLNGFIKCTVPFPFKGVNWSQNDDAVWAAFDVKISLIDKNNQTKEIDNNATSAETSLTSLAINYEADTNGVYEDSKVKFAVAKGTYDLVVPYHVKSVQFIAKTKTNEDNIFGEQQVTWLGTGTIQNEIIHPLPSLGENKIEMKVSYFPHTPNALPLEKFYTFNIRRLDPSRDSTLKNLVIQDYNTSETVYTPDWEFIGGFKEPSKQAADNDVVKTKTDYTVHIPSWVNQVRIRAECLNTSEIYFEQDGATVGYHKTNPRDIPIDEEDALYYDIEEYKKYFDEYPYFDNYPLKIIEHIWELSPDDLKPGINTPLNIVVVPQSNEHSGNNTRRYTLTIIKADPDGELAATLKKLKISDENDVPLLGAGVPQNQFHSDTFKYTVFVPSDVDSVNLIAKPTDGTRILQATATTSDPKQPVTFDDPASFKIDTGITDFDSKREKVVRLVVYKDADGSNTSTYTVTLIKRFPSSLSPRLTGGKNTLNVAWQPQPMSDVKYEVYFSPYAPGSESNDYPEQAAKLWPGSFTGTNAVITGLTDNSQYNVWVRAINTAGIPGDWNKARTIPKNGSSDADYGTVGAAELVDLDFTLTPSPLATEFVPPVFDSSITEYYLTVPAATTNITARGVEVSERVLTNSLTMTEPKRGSWEEPQIITAYSPDGVTPQAYTVNILRRLNGPVVHPEPPALDGNVSLSWEPVTNADSYEIYYHTENIIPKSDIEGTATRWGTVDSTSATITSLTNAQPYYFWVRGVRGGIPGEWSAPVQAEPKSTNNTLGGFTAVPAGSDLSLEGNNYTLILPSDYSGDVYLDAVKGEDKQLLSPASLTIPSPGQGNTTEGSIKVTSHSGSEREYTVTVKQKLPPVTVISSTPMTKSIELVWSPVDGATSYDVFCSKTPLAPGELESMTPVVNVSVYSYTIKELENGTPYYVWIQAKNDIVTGEFNSEHPAPITPGDGTSPVTINFLDLPKENNFINELITTLSWRNDTPLTITVPGEFEPYQWYLDGVPYEDEDGINSTLTINARKLSVATHVISAKITHQNNVYSNNVIVIVRP